MTALASGVSPILVLPIADAIDGEGPLFAVAYIRPHENLWTFLLGLQRLTTRGPFYLDGFDLNDLRFYWRAPDLVPVVPSAAHWLASEPDDAAWKTADAFEPTRVGVYADARGLRFRAGDLIQQGIAIAHETVHVPWETLIPDTLPTD